MKLMGHFVSDCWAIRDFHEHHMVTDTAVESAALAINNGCDLNCGNTYLHIMKAYEKGLVTEETITRAAVRLFTTRYLLGLFDGSEYDNLSYMEVESPRHLDAAEKAAEKSFVLLKNNGILPLDKEKLKTIGIIGPNADSRQALIGNYHGTASRYITIQEGIQDYVGDDVRILTSRGCDLFRDRTEHLAFTRDRIAEAKVVAENSDVVILCMGLDETLEGEEGDTGNSYVSGDKEDIELPGVQRELMEAIADTGKPVVFCLLAGSDLNLKYAAEKFDAVMMLWYPGCQGGKAAAKVLFGEISPSGKLPVTFYESLEELPDFTDYSMKGRTYRYMERKAQFPFGYGLTYSKVAVDKAEVKTCGQKINVEVEVQNNGAYDTEDVVQIYVKNIDSKNAIPNPMLAGFQRIFLKAGECRKIEIPIWEKAFTVVDETGKRMEEGKKFEIYAGCSQPDEKSKELTGIMPVKIIWEK